MQMQIEITSCTIKSSTSLVLKNPYKLENTLRTHTTLDHRDVLLLRRL